MRRSSIGFALALLCGALSITSAGAQTGTPQASPSPVASPLAAVDCATLLGKGSAGDACAIFINASPDAGAVDIYVDGEKTVDALIFGDVSGYLSFPAGQHQVDIVEAGDAVANAAVTDPDVELGSGAAYEVAAIGDLDSMEVLVSEVDLSPLPPGTPLASTRVRAIHAVPDAPAVNITVISDDIAERVFEDISFPTVTQYIVRPPGAYRIQVEVAAMSFASIELDRVDFVGDTVYSMYAIGSVDSGDLRSLPIAVNTVTGESTPRSNPPVGIDQVAQVTSIAIYGGGCENSSGRVSIELTGSGHGGAGAGVVVPWGAGAEEAGSIAAVPVQYAEGEIDDLNFGKLLGGETNSLVVRDGESGEVVACGEIGGVVEKAGRFWQHDRLVLGLAPVNESGIAGVATLTEDTGILEDSINVSVALVEAGAAE